MAYKKKSPLNDELPKTLFGTLIHEAQKSFKNSPGTTESSAEANNRINERGKYAKKKSSGASNIDFSKGNVIGQFGKGKPKTSNASDGIMIRDAGTNTKTVKNNKPKTTVKTKSNTSTKPKPAAKPITSSDSGDRSGGYLKNTKNFSLGGDMKLNVAPMPKFERTVTNARSADYDLIRAKGRGKIDKLKSRLDRREARTANRVDRSVERIKSRQRRSGDRYASKMEARTNTGTNPGYFDSQKRLDAFESPKATPRTSNAGNISSGSKPGQLRMPATNVTGQKAAQGSMKLKPTMSKTQTLSDTQLNKKLNKPAVKKKSTGKTKSLSMTRGEMTKNLTQLATNSTNNDPFLINAQKRAGQ